MSEFITLACPSCNGNLRVTDDIERFSCKYCGREHLVRRSQGHVSLVPIVEKLERIVGGVDKHAAELAIRRLREDRRTVKKRLEEWNSELNYVRRVRSSKITGIFGWGFVALICGIFGFAIFSEGHGDLNCIGLIAGLLSFLCFMYCVSALIKVPGLSRRFEEAQQKVEKFNSYLDEIETDLDKQMKIVER